MNPQNCQAATDNVASGIAAALQAVDCVAGNVTGQAFGRLFAPGGSMATVLTILLTLYVAFFAIQLLTGRSTLGVKSLTPRMMTVGLVLTFATSWVAYQSVVWNLAVGAPDWIAGVLTGDRGSATQTFAAKIDVVFQAVQEANRGSNDISAFSPPGMMWLGAILLLLGTVGVLVTARIALAVLIALGPIFVVMALFGGTRGLFAGWVKGLTLLAMAPLFAVLGGSLMLEMAVPILAALVASAGQVDPQAAMGFFVIGFVHAALMVMVLKVTGAMVGSWTVFGLAVPERDRAGAPPMAAPLAAPAPHLAQAQEASQGIAAARRIDISAQPVAMAANDGGAGVGVSGQRTSTVYPAAPGTAQVQPLTGGGRQPLPPRRGPLHGEDDMIRSSATLLALGLAAAQIASPLQADDARLLEVPYDEARIYRVEGKPKVQATIRFGEDESIENVAIGDSHAWQVTPNKRANLLFVKPLLARASTNMTVVTDKRTYLFDLVASPAGKALYVLSFTYPDKPAGKFDGSQLAQNTAIPPEAAEPAAVTDPALLNFAWRKSGDKKLLPANIYDDGEATFLSWPEGRPVPAILITNSDGIEGPVNFTVRGTTIVVEGVPAQFVLRAGKDKAVVANAGPMRSPTPPRAQAALAQQERR